jgi:hypothetical protein
MNALTLSVIASIIVLEIALFLFLLLLITSRHVDESIWAYADWQGAHPGKSHTHPDAQKLIRAKVVALKRHLKLCKLLHLHTIDVERFEKQEKRSLGQLASQPA